MLPDLVMGSISMVAPSTFSCVFQLDLIRADSIGKIKTSAGGLGRCLPAGVVFLHNRFRLRFLLTDLRSDQGNGLPSCATGIIDVRCSNRGQRRRFPTPFSNSSAEAR